MKRDHEAIRAELDQLERGGKIRPVDVVEAAKDKSSALHECFVWDDGDAAHQYRLLQARNLLRVYVVRPDEGDGQVVRAFVSITSDRAEKDGGYRAIASVMSDRELYSQMLHDAIVQLRNMQKKYKTIKELAAVWSAVDGLHEKPKGTGARRGNAARISNAVAVNG